MLSSCEKQAANSSLRQVCRSHRPQKLYTGFCRKREHHRKLYTKAINIASIVTPHKSIYRNIMRMVQKHGILYHVLGIHHPSTVPRCLQLIRQELGKAPGYGGACDAHQGRQTHPLQDVANLPMDFGRRIFSLTVRLNSNFTLQQLKYSQGFGKFVLLFYNAQKEKQKPFLDLKTLPSCFSCGSKL